MWSFKLHLLKDHVQAHERPAKEIFPSTSSEVSHQQTAPSTNVQTPDTEGMGTEEEWDDFDKEEITNRLALFLAKLRAKSSQTYSAINFDVKHTASLITDIVGGLQEKTMGLIYETNVRPKFGRTVVSTQNLEFINMDVSGG